jgi:glycosyltransferase involved in cell wall biosynthesis
MNKVSEIILIYNVEAFIEKCVRSLMEQTFEDIEYIFINDCSPDKSMQILSGLLLDYPNRMPHVKIINHDRNQGIAKSRNDGLDAATGDYIIFTDSDDWIEKDMVKSMYERAVSTDADIVWCNLVNGEFRKIEDNDDVLSLLINRKVALGPVNKLVRKSIFDKVRYLPNFNNGEDLNANVKLHFYANKTVYIDKYFYNITIHKSSLTHSPENILKNGEDLVSNVIDIEKFLKEHQIDKKYENELLFCKVYAKEYLLNIGNDKSLDKWRTIFPETNTHVFSLPYPIYTKIEFWAMAHGCYWPFKLSRWFRSVLS